MKKSIALLALTIASIGYAVAQNMGFNYQGIARNGAGKALIGKQIGLKISLIDLTPTGAESYSETHATTTSPQGIFNVVIGNGNAIIGSFNTINWAKIPKYIKLAIDTSGGNNYTDLITTQLVSVPYAKYAESTRAQTLNVSLTGDTLRLSSSNFVIVPGISSANHPIQQLGCKTDSDCPLGYTCAADGTCQPMAQKPDGAACLAATECASGICQGGACQSSSSCPAGFADCNGSAADGCETNLSSSTTSCGACGISCPTGTTCQGGACISTASICGNGKVESGEDCDDGNSTPGDGCDVTCNVEVILCGTPCPTGFDCASGSCETKSNYEPNNNFATAANILAPNNTGYFQKVISKGYLETTTADADVYSAQIPAGRSFVIKIVPIGAAVANVAKVYAATNLQTPIISLANNGTEYNFPNTNTTTVTYYLVFDSQINTNNYFYDVFIK